VGEVDDEGANMEDKIVDLELNKNGVYEVSKKQKPQMWTPYNQVSAQQVDQFFEKVEKGVVFVERVGKVLIRFVR
jgi:hypothetical protein